MQDGGGTRGLDVPQGKTLTIEPGAILEFDRNPAVIDGTLIAKGAIFTSRHDDAAGLALPGSTGKPQAGDWVGLEVRGSAPGSVVTECEFRTQARTTNRTVPAFGRGAMAKSR